MAGNVSDNIGDKIYAAAPPEGWCAIERRSAGLRVQVEFDPSLSPFLGLWLCYGGWPEGHPKRQYCVALEPCTAPVDSLATAMARRMGEEHLHPVNATYGGCELSTTCCIVNFCLDCNDL